MAYSKTFIIFMLKIRWLLFLLVVCYFLLMCDIFEYCIDTIIYLSSHLLMNVWVVSNFWLLWIKLLWIWCIVISLWEEWLDDMIGKCRLNFLRPQQIIFQSSCAIDQDVLWRLRVTAVPHPHQHEYGQVVAILIVVYLLWFEFTFSVAVP